MTTDPCTPLDLEPIKARIKAATDDEFPDLSVNAARRVYMRVAGKDVAWAAMRAALVEATQPYISDLSATVQEIETLRATITRLTAENTRLSAPPTEEEVALMMNDLSFFSTGHAGQANRWRMASQDILRVIFGNRSGWPAIPDVVLRSLDKKEKENG